MIKVKKGNIKIKGTGNQILAELAVAVKSVKTALADSGIPEEIASKLVSDVVRFANMDTKELARELIDSIGEHLERDDS